MCKKPLVGVSQCLLGDAVRYDGLSKPNALIIEQMSQIFELVAVCPEVEVGLGIPRPPVQLTGSITHPKMTGRDNISLDVTSQLQRYCSTKIPQLHELAGFIFKSRSPSCGLATTPLFVDGQCVTETADGLFAAAFKRYYSQLPVIDELGLKDSPKKNHFIDEVLAQFCISVNQ